MNHPAIDYLKAQGRIGRKPYIIANVVLAVFLITAQFYFISSSQEALGVEIEHPSQIIIPIWGALAVWLAKVALIPAIIMRARDAGWPTWFFAGLYALHMVFDGLYGIFDLAPLPAEPAFVVAGMAFFAVVTLMVKPTEKTAEEQPDLT